MLSHEKLDVYQIAIRFVGVAYRAVTVLPRGHGDLARQLKTACTSIPLNIAEGAGKPTDTSKASFYGIARGSAMECGAIFDVLAEIDLIDPALHRKGKCLLERLVSMLTVMSGANDKVDRSGSGSRSGSRR